MEPTRPVHRLRIVSSLWHVALTHILLPGDDDDDDDDRQNEHMERLIEALVVLAAFVAVGVVFACWLYRRRLLAQRSEYTSL